MKSGRCSEVHPASAVSFPRRHETKFGADIARKVGLVQRVEVEMVDASTAQYFALLQRRLEGEFTTAGGIIL